MNYKPVERSPLLQYLLIALGLAIYAGSFFFPLMDKDAAHHANIALNMYEHHNYTDLIDRGEDYLDKPHLLFWVSAACFKLFGVNTFAHRFPAVLFSLLAVFSTYRLGRHLYGRKTALWASLILATAQSFVMAIMDARMETPLTAFISLGLWQLVVYVDKRKLVNLFFGAFGAAMAFSTKGWIGPVVIFVPLFFYLLAYKKWAVLTQPLTWLFIPLFALFVSPVLYAYYVQYDLHPEKVIRGTTHHSGLRFILWNQLFERSQGFDQGGHGRNSDYFFLYHTFLWAFLPWSIVAYAAVFFWLRRTLYQKKWRAVGGFAALGFAFVLFAISFSKFKMPHYIIMLFPLAALFTAPYLRFALMHAKLKKFYTSFQTGLVAILLLAAMGLNYFFLPKPAPGFDLMPVAIILLAGWLATVLVTLLLRKQIYFPYKFWYISIGISIVLNFLLNYNFFPQVMKYQAGNEMARSFKNLGKIKDSDVLLVDIHAHSFDFYTGHNHTPLPPEEFKAHYPEVANKYFLMTQDIRDYLQREGYTVEPVFAQPDYNVSTIRMKFLNPATRGQSLDTLFLARVHQP